MSKKRKQITLSDEGLKNAEKQIHQVRMTTNQSYTLSQFLDDYLKTFE